MTHEIGHIWCGAVGPIIGDKQITIKDAEGLNLAINLKRRHDQSEADFRKKEKKIAKLVHKIYVEAAEPGDEIHYYKK